MKKKLRNMETREAAAVKRMQRPQVMEDSLTVISGGGWWEAEMVVIE